VSQLAYFSLELVMHAYLMYGVPHLHIDHIDQSFHYNEVTLVSSLVLVQIDKAGLITIVEESIMAYMSSTLQRDTNILRSLPN